MDKTTNFPRVCTYNLDHDQNSMTRGIKHAFEAILLLDAEGQHPITNAKIVDLLGGDERYKKNIERCVSILAHAKPQMVQLVKSSGGENGPITDVKLVERKLPAQLVYTTYGNARKYNKSQELFVAPPQPAPPPARAFTFEEVAPSFAHWSHRELIQAKLMADRQLQALIDERKT